MTECLLATMEAKMKDKVGANLREIMAEMRTNQDRMEAKTETNNEKAEVLQNKMWNIQDKMKAILEDSLEKTEANQ
jgi:hypothetical protein